MELNPSAKLSEIKQRIKDLIYNTFDLRVTQVCKDGTYKPYPVLIVDNITLLYIQTIFTRAEIGYIISDIYLISDKRYLLPLPCIYFVRPTEENVNYMYQDIKGSIYRSYHIVMFGSTSHDLLDYLKPLAQHIKMFRDFPITVLPLNYF